MSSVIEPTTNGHETTGTATWTVKRGLAQMLKGGVIMDVVTADQAKIAEDAGAVSVMALERVPADIRRDGGVARMSDPELIHQIIDAVTIPVMAKCRIGHFVEAQVLEAIGVDYIDESEVLTPADEEHHVYKHPFKVPFVCGARDLGEALRRIGEGAAMIRSKGEAGTGDVVEAVRHIRTITGQIKRLGVLGEEELMAEAKQLGAPYELVKLGRPRRTTAGGALHGGRHRHAGRRRAHDAARLGGRLRRLGHLQERRPGPARGGDRQGDDALPGPGDRGRGLARAGRADGRHLCADARRTEPDGGARLVTMTLTIGVLAVQGDLPSTRRACSAPRAPWARRSRCGRCAARRTSPAWTV